MPPRNKKRNWKKKRNYSKYKARISRFKPRGSIYAENYIHYFKRTVRYDEVESPGAVSGSFIFKLQDCPNYTEFINLFDQYKLIRIKLTFVPRFSGADIADANINISLPALMTCIDYNDDSTLAEADMLQYANLRITRGDKVHTRTIYPKVLKEVYNYALSTAYGSTSTWLTTANYTVPHYGLKYLMTTTGLTAGKYLYTPYATFYIACKGIK